MLAVKQAEIGVQRRSTTATRRQHAASRHVVAEEVRHRAAFDIPSHEVALDPTRTVAEVCLNLAAMRAERLQRARFIGYKRPYLAVSSYIEAPSSSRMGSDITSS